MYIFIVFLVRGAGFYFIVLRKFGFTGFLFLFFDGSKVCDSERRCYLGRSGVNSVY